MQIITRAQWGARHDDGFGPAPVPYSRTYLHQSVTIAPDLVWVDADGDGVEDDEEKAMRLLEDIGEQRFGRGISYTWCIPPSGRIYEGHSVDRQGSHTGGLNDIARAICLIGRYQDTAPTPAQIRSIAWLLQHNVAKGWTKTAALTGGHRDVKATECPGDLAYAAIPTINQLAAGPAITEEDTVSWNDRFKAPNGKEYSAAEYLVWTNWYVGQLTAQVAGLQTAVDKLAGAVGGDDLTAEELKAAVKAGTAEALAEGLVKIDVTVNGAQT